MHHLEVKFKVTDEKGKDTIIQVCSSASGSYIVTDEKVVHWINKNGNFPRSRWITNNKQLAQHMQLIQKRFYEVTGNFKWRLPKRMRQAIAWGKIDLIEHKATLVLDRWIDTHAFDSLLRVHCWNHQIKPVLPVYIHDATQHTRLLFDLRLGAKQRFPLRAPITDSDMDRLGPKPTET